MQKRCELLEVRMFLCGNHESPDSSASVVAPALNGFSIDEPWRSASTPMPDLAPASIPGAFREYVDLTSQPGRSLLRFGTAFANVGTAPLVLTADSQASNADGTQSVLQVMYQYNAETGKFTSTGTREAGRFVKHPGHSHFHLEGYASYRLVERIGKNGTGDVAYRSDGRAAVGDKVGFCIRNTLETYELEPGIDSDTLPYYYGGGQPPVSCGFLQGLHVGRADVYGSSYDEQWIDITGVPAGKYWVEVSLDAKNAIAESDETNNVRRWRITLGDTTGGSGGVGDDRYDRKRANDSFARATDLGVASNSSETGLTIGAGNDIDTFRFQAASSGRYSVQSKSTTGNVDLYLYNKLGTLISQSTNAEVGDASAPAAERVTNKFKQGETYFVRVRGFGGKPVQNYSLEFGIKPLVSIYASTDTAVETTNQPAKIVVRRNGPTDRPIRILYTLTGTAENGEDIVSLSGTLQFDTGRASKSINIIPLLDQLAEGIESLTLTLSTSIAYAIDSRKRFATVQIKDA